MNQTKKTAPTLKAEIAKKVDELPTISEKIRFLDSQNVPRADISRYLSVRLNRYIRYQWVKNVLDAEAFKKRSQ